MGCVYQAKNKVNGKLYIGQTIHELGKRKYQHKWSADKGNTSVFLRAIRKYGWGNFEWKILFKSNDSDKLNNMEVKLIKRFGTLTPNGYNVANGGERFAGFTGGMTGKKHSEETKAKMKKARKLFHHTSEAKAKLSIASKGRKLSDEHKAKISKSLRGRKLSEEHKARVGKANRGRTLPPISEETRARIREASSGRKLGPFSKEHRKNLSEAHKGHVHSEEHKAKIRASILRRWVIKKEMFL